jgi:tetratricopeptide (TPR) repeat protein
VRLLAVLLFLAAEPPMRPEAQARYDEGMAHYAAHEYRAALRALEAAYALDPRPELLFAEAQATRLLGDCVAALPLYQRFLATGPPPQQIEATRIAVARCQAVAAAITPPASVRTPPLPLPPPALRWYRDGRGGALVGAGLVGLGVGAALLTAAAAAERDARAIHDRYDAFDARWNQAERRRGWGLAAVIAGGALIAAGAGRYLWVAVHGRETAVGAGTRF